MSRSSPTLLHGDWTGPNLAGKRPTRRRAPSFSSSSALTSNLSPDLLAQTLNRFGQTLKAELVNLGITQRLRLEVIEAARSNSYWVHLNRKAVTVYLKTSTLHAIALSPPEFARLIDRLICDLNLRTITQQHPVRHYWFPVAIIAHFLSIIALFPLAALLSPNSAPAFFLPALITTCLTFCTSLVVHEQIAQPQLKQLAANHLSAHLGEKRTDQLLSDNRYYAPKTLHKAIAHQHQLASQQARQIDQLTTGQLGPVEF